MIDLYLKAPTEVELLDVLYKAEIIVTDGASNMAPAEGVSMDVIGSFSKIIEDTEVHYPDFHVNLRVTNIEEDKLALLEPYIITLPETPYRTWG